MQKTGLLPERSVLRLMSLTSVTGPQDLETEAPARDGNGDPTSLVAIGKRRMRFGWSTISGLLRPSEWLVLTYFSYAAIFSSYRARSIPVIVAGGVIAVLARKEFRTGSRTYSIVRDWLTAPCFLVAYWTVDWFPQPVRDYKLENSWIHLDRLILNDWGMIAAIESTGRLLPFVLELCYSLLYVLPPVLIGILYLYRRRERVDRYLFTLLLGTLTTYVLLPHFPSISPREVFPNKDLPASITPFRALNLWLLGNFDIHASVFPSSHVTVGYSAAFAMLLALPERRRVGWIVAAIATGVAVATVYGRYHYAVDVFAGMAVSLLACVLGAVLHPSLRLSTLWKRNA